MNKPVGAVNQRSFPTLSYSSGRYMSIPLLLYSRSDDSGCSED